MRHRRWGGGAQFLSGALRSRVRGSEDWFTLSVLQELVELRTCRLTADAMNLHFPPLRVATELSLDGMGSQLGTSGGSALGVL